MSIRSAAAALAATYTTPEPSPDTPDGPQCLRWVWLCFGSVQSNLPPLASVAYAKQGWIYSKMQHPGDRRPPAGAPVYFSGSYGHIAIATGNGEEVRSTEWPWGRVGTTTISAIEKAWGRTYYGWTGDMLGHSISFTGTAGGNAVPIPADQPKRIEEFMAGKISTIRATADGVNNTDQLFWENANGALIWIQGSSDLALLQRYKAASDGNAFDHFYPAEIKKLNDVYLAPTVTAVDPATVQTAVNAAFAKLGQTPDAAAVAAAVEAALKDDFASVPGAVLDAESKRLAN